jgi:phage terminase large subunit-like protein
VPAPEGWLVCGRRAGKSFTLALIAVFLACFRNWQPYLAPGERATVMVIATDRRQARVIFRYVSALLNNVPMLAKLIERETADTFDLIGSITIEVQAASYRSTRGYTIVAALCDEIAFWRTDNAAEPDYEIINALRPGMATIPGAMLLCASSPYARRGALWDAHRRHFGKDGDPILVWQADTLGSLR